MVSIEEIRQMRNFDTDGDKFHCIFFYFYTFEITTHKLINNK